MANMTHLDIFGPRNPYKCRNATPHIQLQVRRLMRIAKKARIDRITVYVDPSAVPYDVGLYEMSIDVNYKGIRLVMLSADQAGEDVMPLKQETLRVMNEFLKDKEQ